jgi:hypothetical protein
MVDEKRAKEAGSDTTTTQGIFIPLIDLERPQRGGMCGCRRKKLASTAAVF